jgi:uncharacterized membrane protein
MSLLLARTLLGTIGFMVLDGLWLGLLMTGFYRDRLAPIARISNGTLAPNWSAALVVYVCLGIGIAVFALPRVAQASTAAASGALLGLVIYGVYDFTNYSTLKDWPLVLALADTAWGAVAAGVCATLVWMITR